MNEEITSRIKALKKEKDVVLLAHYYVDGAVQEIADYVGDSFYLAKVATKVKESNILFAGVSFMGESAKLLNPSKKKEIKIKNVNYFYDDKMVYHDLSMLIKPGINVIVGENGCGKSTLLKLLYGTVAKGKVGDVFFNDESIYQHTLECIRNRITIVPQIPFLYKDTVVNNIVNGRYYDKKKLEDVCTMLNLDKNVLDKEIEENGNNLSGGQKQKIAIARGLYENNDVLIFDEITSSLDTFTQKSFVEIIKKLKDSKIIIIITHRFKYLNNADKIFFLKDGKVICSGAHETLLMESDEYKKMCTNY